MLPPSIHRTLILALVLALAACDSPQRRAFRELSARGIDANGPALTAATARGDTDVLKLLLTAGTFTGQRDAQGRSPLHIAIELGNLDDAWLLIDAGANLDAEAPGKVTPIAIALSRGESALVYRLLEKGAKPDGRTPDGERLLAWAIRHGRTAFLRQMFEKGADPHQKSADGDPLLHVALESGNRALVRELIKLGADCGAVDADGESAVVHAIRRGWTDLLPEIVRAGADPHRPDKDGLTPMEKAYREDRDDLVKLLTLLDARPSQGNLDEELLTAYDARDFGWTRLLLSCGAKPSEMLVRRAAADDEAGFLHLFLGYTRVPEGLLAQYCRGGGAHIATLLLAHGASINPSHTPFLDTPFSTAMDHGDDALAAYLLDRGAHPNLRGRHGEPPLLIALVRGQAATVRRLIEHGAPVNTALRSPASESLAKMARGATMRWLLRKDSGVTPLMLAVDSGSVDTTRALIEAGARKNVWTRRSSIWPINIAAGHGDVPMMRLLLGKDPYVEERRVLVDLSEQRLWVYGPKGDEILSTRVSTGRSGYRTRTGTFAITNRYRAWTSTIYHSSMPYFQRLSCSDFGFHQGYVPGYPASHGCIRVPAGTANKLFNITDVGDRVEIVP
ncbi:MAG: ankyrin repeat domain-containing protein [Akkermansiaceae bacterium]|nr:ankyrin repeat domain-containing protein [Akkermansiaceae bacterium]